LLAAPEPSEDESAWVASNPERHRLSPRYDAVGDGRPFFNEPHRDFSRAEQREQFARAIQTVDVPVVDDETTVEQAGEMIGRAQAAFGTWRSTDPVKRANCLTRAAAVFRSQRDELAAIVLKEAGKPWRHADADVCEAIDFCEFYARQSIELFRGRRLGSLVGEQNEQWHIPRGPAVVISPWNFPMAITCGMTAAALVTGNPVVLKPAEQSPGIARRICEGLWEAGVPKDVLQFAPGKGETVGAALVRDPRVALICFTGSKAVGLDILGAAAHTSQEQWHVKQVVCEMGGKNAIIVDESADLDEAVPAVIESAFGYSGQRCSACARVVVLDAIYDAFVARSVDATKSLVIADPREPCCDVGHLIDDEAGEKVRRYIDIGQTEGTLALSMQAPAGLEEQLGKPVVGPHIFTDIQPQHRLATEEVFGPVLAVMRAGSLDEALRIANGVCYRLTGGLFSRTPSHLEAARREFMVGNLYLNRSSVGALVGRQPFGGFGLSGTGTQAGGDEYLRHFVLPRVACENTMRRGFAPGLES
jgi:RHH-type proline utilization regulon transcriptional repressor/proline dehydrogenase/delta 1-pyrroline-5-carboxylate dehydrogenase